MTPATAEQLLMEYPLLWQSYQAKREAVLGGGHSSSNWTDVYYGGSGTYSDKTAAKAVKLAEMACSERTLTVIGKWIDSTMKPAYRLILVSRWRRQSWEQIARRQRQSVQEVRRLWSQMIEELAAVIPFAGRV